MQWKSQKALRGCIFLASIWMLENAGFFFKYIRKTRENGMNSGYHFHELNTEHQDVATGRD